MYNLPVSYIADLEIHPLLISGAHEFNFGSVKVQFLYGYLAYNPSSADVDFVGTSDWVLLESDFNDNIRSLQQGLN